MELEKTQKNVGKMLERFRKGKEDMSVVFTKAHLSRGGKMNRDVTLEVGVIIFRNEKKIVDGSYNSKSSDLPKSFQCCIREGDDARCQMIFSCKEAGLGWVLCGFEPREENEDCYTIVLHCVDDLLDILVEAHVQHLVGLVQHDGLHVGNIDGVVAIVVHQAAGGGDYDLAARFQLALLLGPARRRRIRRRS